MASQWSGYITVGDGQLHYVGAGHGKKLLICFHGYRNSSSLFLPLAEHLSDEYTMVSVDMPHHGRSHWPDGKLMQPMELATVVNELCRMNDVDKASLIGYSMGGRICLKVAEQMPKRVDKLVLVASDGLAFNPFYYFMTRTGLGRRIFSSFLTNPNRYNSVLEWAKRRNIIDASRYRFVKQYIESQAERELLLKIWPAMSLLIPNGRKLKANINTQQLPVHIIMGEHDRIIPVSLAKRFQKDMKTVKLYILDKGHRVFDSDTLPLIAQCLRS